MNKLTLPTADNNNNIDNVDIINENDKNNAEEQSITTELTSIPGVSASFLIPNDDA